MLIEFQCPHCDCLFVVDDGEVNCRVIRHFVFKNGTQLNPHASKKDCDRAFEEKLGYGCAKPILLSKETGDWKAVPCDYI